MTLNELVEETLKTNKHTMNTFKHQGDVPMYLYEGEIKGEKVPHNGSLILAWGEATGHNHTITVPNIEDMDAVRTPDGGWLLTLRSEATVTHQEHHPIKLAPGTYRIGREREMDWFSLSARQVVD